jgi:hypothetical protein
LLIHAANPEKPAPSTGVVVLGPSRSGTSAVTGMFVSAGFCAGPGDELMPAAQPNPRGYFENLPVVRANNEILAALDATFFDPPAADAQIAASAWAQPRLQTLLQQLITAADGAPLALKDPRIGSLMPLWDGLIRDLLHPVLVIRDPVEIALSLNRRDGTPMSFGLAAWEVHMTNLLTSLIGRRVTVVRYEHLLQSPELPQSIVASVAAGLGSGRADRVDPARAALGLERGLHRNHVGEHDHEQHLTVCQLQLWRQLVALPNCEQVITHAPEPPQPNEAAVWGLRAERQRIRLLDEAAALDRRAEQAEQVIAQSQQALAQSQQALVQSQQALAQADLHTAETERTLAAEQTRSNRLAEDLALARVRTNDLSEDAQVMNRRFNETLEYVGRLEQSLDVAYSSWSWRISRPVRSLGALVRRARALQPEGHGRGIILVEVNPGPADSASELPKAL